MELELIVLFLGSSILLTLMPGPDNIYVLVESITNGSRNAILISLGLVLGVMVHTLAAATGLSIIIKESATLFKVIKFAGAAYLLYLAFIAWREKPIPVGSREAETEGKSAFKLIRKGVVMNVLNPKVSLFFIAFLPQFISESGVNISVQMVVLGLLFMLQAFLIFAMISLVAGKLTGFLRRPSFWKGTKVVKIATFLVLGVLLATSEK